MTAIKIAGNQTHKISFFKIRIPRSPQKALILSGETEIGVVQKNTARCRREKQCDAKSSVRKGIQNAMGGDYGGKI